MRLILMRVPQKLSFGVGLFGRIPLSGWGKKSCSAKFEVGSLVYERGAERCSSAAFRGASRCAREGWAARWSRPCAPPSGRWVPSWSAVECGFYADVAQPSCLSFPWRPRGWTGCYFEVRNSDPLPHATAALSDAVQLASSILHR